jgi:hypothetical protein
MNSNIAGTWIGDWIWGAPLIMVTVAIHVCGLAVIGERVAAPSGRGNLAANDLTVEMYCFDGPRKQFAKAEGVEIISLETLLCS